MSVKLTNNFNINPVIAGWLYTDNYDNQANKFLNKKVYSATSLLKSSKQNILPKRINNLELDISTLIKSRIGQAIHDSTEKAWRNNLNNILNYLNYPQEYIDKIVIDPKNSNNKDIIPFYFEKRFFKEIDNDVVITGQVDQIFNGQLLDIKSTSTYSFMNGSMHRKYQLQGSIYRWLAPEIITKDSIIINYVFTDWKKSLAESEFNYPKAATIDEKIPLLSIEETDNFIKEKVYQLLQDEHKPQELMTQCSDEELWLKPPIHKYYSDPLKANRFNRCQKSFSNIIEAENHLKSKGKGKILTVESKPGFCEYCTAFTICKQKDKYFE